MAPCDFRGYLSADLLESVKHVASVGGDGLDFRWRQPSFSPSAECCDRTGVRFLEHREPCHFPGDRDVDVVAQVALRHCRLVDRFETDGEQPEVVPVVQAALCNPWLSSVACFQAAQHRAQHCARPGRQADGFGVVPRAVPRFRRRLSSSRCFVWFFVSACHRRARRASGRRSSGHLGLAHTGLQTG